MKSTVCYPAIDVKTLMVSVISALQGVKPDDSEKWASHMEEGDGSYTRVTVSAMLEGKKSISMSSAMSRITAAITVGPGQCHPVIGCDCAHLGNRKGSVLTSTTNAF
jgi:hypothetical protein